MGESVDNKVVAMTFDNKQFEKAVQQTLSSMDSLTKALQLSDGLRGFAGVTAAAQKVDVTSVSAGLEDINWSLVAVKTMAETVFRNMTTAAMNAGTRIAKALTIQGAQDGFGEYELKMGSIQTIMASTGETVEVVNQKLAELNAYSDKTIYSFSDMTSNIGKFTNAGVKLGPAVDAIQGIANVAAISGANAEEASRSMYNFAQALSSGFVKLVDWKSIELANMATVDFKTELIKSAVAAGTLKDAGNGMYKVLTKNGSGGAMKETISATKMFNDSLAYQWMTTEVLTGTLGRYADETSEIGAKATQAATEVKTFTQMMDTVRESIGSGWAVSWEYIFGGKEEATKLWTSVANGIGAIIKPSEEARNAILKFWSEAGGRKAVIAGFSNIFKALGAVLLPISRAFNNFFPKNTGKVLVYISKKFEEFTAKLIPSKKLIYTIQRAVTGLLSVLSLAWKTIDTGITIASEFVSELIAASGIAENMSGLFYKTTDSVSAFFTSLNEASSTAEFFDTVLNSVRDIIADVVGWIEKLRFGFDMAGDATKGAADSIFAGIKQLASESVEQVKDIFAPLGEAITSVFKSTGEGLNRELGPVFGAIGDFLKKINITDVLLAILAIITGKGMWDMAVFIKTIRDMVISITTGVGSMLNAVSSALGAFEKSLNAKALREIATAILILAVALFVLAGIDAEGLKKGMTVISIIMAEFLGIIKAFDKMSPDTAGMMAAAAAMNLFATAILLISFAVSRLGKMDPKVLIKGLLAVTILLAEMSAMATLIKTNKDILWAGISMLFFASALSKLTKVVSTLGEMDTAALKQGLIALGVLFSFIVVAARVIDPAKAKALGVNMLLLAFAIKIMASSIEQLGSMSLEELGKGLGAMAIGLLLMVTALNFIPADSAAKAAGVLVLSIAIAVLAAALYLLGSIDWETMKQSLASLAIALGIIGVFLIAISGAPVLAGAAALAIVSVALLLLAVTLEKIGSLSIEEIGKALLALALVFVILGAAGYLLVGAVPGLLGLGAAMLLLGLGFLAAGMGVALFAGGIAALAVALNSGGPAILEFIANLAVQLPMIALALAKAIGAFARGLIAEQASLTQALASLFNVVIDALIMAVPKVLELLDIILTGVITLLTEKIPMIVDAVLQILQGILLAIQEHMPIIAAAAGQIIADFINVLSTNTDMIIYEGSLFIQGLIKGIGQESEAIIETAMETIITFIDGLATAIEENGPKFEAAAGKLASAVFNAVLNLLVPGGTYDFASLGRSMADGVRKGIEAGIEAVASAGRNLVKDAFGATKKESRTNSPSKLFMIIGASWVEGLVLAVQLGAGQVVTAARNVVGTAYKAMETAGNAAVDVFSNLTEPVITPVVDLDGVYASAKKVATIMDGMPAMSSAGTINARMSPASGKGVNDDQGAATTEINYTQNNYSPKALSRLDIYRGTQNQLIRLKGLGGVG